MDFIKETLSWVNAVRAENNIGDPLEDLPKGARGEATSCPLACALLAESVSRSAGVIFDWFDRTCSMPMPACAGEFVDAFDRGELPQYDENA